MRDRVAESILPLPSLECPDCPYRGLTYGWWFDNPVVHWLWERLLCPHNIHLFDEVHSSRCSDDPPELAIYDHELGCDACGLMVGIAGIMEYKEWESIFKKWHNLHD